MEFVPPLLGSHEDDQWALLAPAGVATPEEALSGLAADVTAFEAFTSAQAVWRGSKPRRAADRPAAPTYRFTSAAQVAAIVAIADDVPGAGYRARLLAVQHPHAHARLLREYCLNEQFRDFPRYEATLRAALPHPRMSARALDDITYTYLHHADADPAIIHDVLNHPSVDNVLVGEWVWRMSTPGIPMSRSRREFICRTMLSPTWAHGGLLNPADSSMLMRLLASQTQVYASA